MLQTGCEIEPASFGDAEWLERTIALGSVIAWRILLLPISSRETAELEASVLLAEFEMGVIRSLSLLG